MNETSFFARGEGLTLAELAELCGAELVGPSLGEARLSGIATLDAAGKSDISFFDNARYRPALEASRAGCVIIGRKHRDSRPEAMPALIVSDVQGAFARAGAALYPSALAPQAMTGETGISPMAHVDASARLEEGVVVEPFASVGPHAEIGRGTVLASGSAVGAGCRVGRDCRIGGQTTLQHALVGNRVIIHPGVSIGQDGFGYAIGAAGIVKMVQIGRVIIQDGVEIGAGTTIDRGAVRDTVIGENTKIDNQVQIAHNVVIGRNCVIVSQVGIAGSATLGDGVVIGGQSGVNGHVTIGDGAQIAAVSSVAGDVPPGSRWGGAPAHPVRDWLREVMWVQEMAKAGRKRGKGDE